MNRRLLGGVVLLGLASQALGGCATSEVALQTELARAKAEQMNEVAARPAAPANVSPVKVRDAVYMGSDVTHSDHGMPLPPSLERKSMSLHKGQTMGFQEIAGLIARETRVPVSVAVTTPNGKSSGPEASGAGGASPFGGGGSSMSGPALTPTQQMPRAGSLGGNPAGGLANGPLPPNFDVTQAAAAILAGQGQNGASPAVQPQVLPQQISGIDNSWGDLGIPGRMRVDFDGTLPQFLDLVGTNYNVAWEFVGGQIVFERAQMRIFDVASLPILTKESFSLTSGSGSDGGSGSGTKTSGDAKQTASTETSSDIQADIKGALDTIVTDGAFKLNGRTGQVTVLASPQTLRRVSVYLKELNNQLSKQVAINVKVYSVVLSDGDNYQNQVQQALSTGGNGFTYGTGGTFSGGATANVASSTAAAGNIGWAILSPTSRFSGTQGLLSALSTKGDVSVVTSASVIARNGFPVPVQSANTRGYVKSININQGSSGGIGGTTVAPTAQVETSTITTGFNLHLTPNIMRDGTILLQYGINISDLVGANNGFDNYSVLGENVQLPNVNQRNFIQEADIPNGATLVLSGFEQVRASSQVAGPVSPSLFLLGGSDVANLRREILVIAITPTLLDMSAAANPPAVR